MTDDIKLPEVVAWRLRKPVVNDQGETVGATAWELSDAPGFLPWWTNDPLIRLSDHEAASAADKARIAELESVLSECAASLAWNCFGECRAVHGGPIMPAQMALEHSRTALQADRDQQYDMKVKAREQRDEVTTKLSTLYAECEKLRKDAERYRWLRDSSSDDLCVVRIDYWSDEYVGTAGVEVIDGHHLDSDVDAARATFRD